MTIQAPAPAVFRRRLGQLRPAHLGAWLVFAVSAAVLMGLELVWDPAHFADLSVYRAEALMLFEGRDLYGALPGVADLNTYPPFAAVAFLPLLLVPLAAAEPLSLLVNLGLVVWASHLSLRRLSGAPADLRVATALLAAVVLWCEPVVLTSQFGQINLLILCLVLWDFSLPEGSPWRGVGIGLAAAIKVTPGIFIVYLVLTKRFRAALGSVLTLLATVAASAVLAPSSTWDYWTHNVIDPARVGRLENSVNQSIQGWIVRAAHTTETGLSTTVVVVVVAALGMAAAVYCYRRHGDTWAVLVVALTGLLISPISWSHHWVWCVPLLALAWREAQVLLLPTLLVFWSFVVWFVPHGDGVELRLDGLQVAMSGWYVAYAGFFIVCATLAARRSKNPDPLLRGSGFSHGASGRADRI